MEGVVYVKRYLKETAVFEPLVIREEHIFYRPSDRAPASPASHIAEADESGYAEKFHFQVESPAAAERVLSLHAGVEGDQRWRDETIYDTEYGMLLFAGYLLKSVVIIPLPPPPPERLCQADCDAPSDDSDEWEITETVEEWKARSKIEAREHLRMSQDRLENVQEFRLSIPMESGLGAGIQSQEVRAFTGLREVVKYHTIEDLRATREL